MSKALTASVAGLACPSLWLEPLQALGRDLRPQWLHHLPFPGCRKTDLACVCHPAWVLKFPMLVWPILVHLGCSSTWQGGYSFGRAEDHMQERMSCRTEGCYGPAKHNQHPFSPNTGARNHHLGVYECSGLQGITAPGNDAGQGRLSFQACGFLL